MPATIAMPRSLGLEKAAKEFKQDPAKLEHIPMR
jgi:hypothetical protein